MKTKFRLFGLLLALSFGAASLTSCGDGTSYEEVILKQPTCTTDGLGYLKGLEGNEDLEQRTIPALGHNLVKKTIAPTCTEQGYDIYYCSRCGFEDHRDNYVPALGHDYHHYVIDPTCLAPGHDESYCSRCGADEYEPHAIDPLGHKMQYAYTVEPTCTKDGYKVYRCALCGYVEKGETLEAKGHHFLYSKTVAPTCTEDGYDLEICEHCQEEHRHNFVPALGHNLVEDIHDSTCTEDGYKRTYCTVCDYENIEKIPAKGHDLQHFDGKEATCTEDGYLDYDACSRGDYSTYQEVHAYGHHYVTLQTPATCTEEGYVTHTCLHCGDSYETDRVPAKGHNYQYFEDKEPTCDEAGYKPYRVCLDCGDTNYEGLPATGEEHEYHDQVIAPTSRSEGYTLHTCTKCGSTYKTDITKPLGRGFVYDSEQAITSGKHSAKRVASERDDDYYYFVFYFGRAEEVALHHNVSFKWNKAMEDLRSYPKSIIEPRPMDLLQSLTLLKEKVFAGVKESLLEHTPMVPTGSFNVSKVADTSLQSKAAALLQSGFSVEALEIADPSLDSLATTFKNLGSSYALGDNLSQYIEGYEYDYAPIASLDFYLGVRYDIKNEAFVYEPYSVLSGAPTEKVYAAPGGIEENIRSLDVSQANSESISKPATYKTNHPLVELTGTWMITNGGVGQSILTGGGFDLTVNIGGLKSYLDQGYDFARFDISYSFGSGGVLGLHSQCLFQLASKDFSTAFWKQTCPNPGQTYSMSFYKGFNLFAGDNGFGIRWTQCNGAFAIDVRDLRYKITLLKSAAHAEGAYAGTNVAGFSGESGTGPG